MGVDVADGFTEVAGIERRLGELDEFERRDVFREVHHVRHPVSESTISRNAASPGSANWWQSQ
jgi:hypothetical protein